MTKHNKKNSHRSSSYRLIAAALSVTGVSSLTLPYLAIAQTVPPTSANTPILNRASGTYRDPNNPNTEITTTSNEVRVTVAEIAGITNTPAGIIDTTGGSVSTNDLLNFDFLVTNTGNAPSNIFFPAVANITTQGLNAAGLQYQLDLNNDGDFDDPDEVARTGEFTTTTAIAAGASVRVRVIGTVTATDVGNAVSVRYGNTGANDNSAGTQNQPDSGAEPPLNGADPIAGAPLAAGEIRTVNFNDPAIAGDDEPVNGVREAAALQSTTIATAVRNIALSTVLKTRVAYDPRTPAVIDDLLTYRLDLRVASTSPNPSIYTSTALEGTVINVNNTPPTGVQRILISDVIPAGTVIDHTFDAAQGLPSGWQAVYQYGAANLASTTIPIISAATGALPAAVWSTTAPDATTAPNVRRVGYIFTGTLSPGFSTELVPNAFRIRVVTSGLNPATGGVINNIAQVFGETVGDATNRVVYDESGDQNPNNFEGAVPPAPEGSLFVPSTDTGVPNPGLQDTDGANNNSGTGIGGEVNIFPIVPPGGILNGPNNVPGASGINNNQDDFTNKSAELPEANSVPGTTYDPNPIIFNNTFQNPPSNSTRLDTVRLLPLPPNDPSIPTTIAGSTQLAGDIPNDTLVTITFNGQSATYIYNNGAYTLQAGTPILVDNVQPGVLNNYTVTLNLPAGTQLSVDRFVAAEAATPGTGAARAGFNVPIVAFVDNDNNNAFSSANDPIFNITIDRGYTGYVRLRKQSQILQGSNPRPVSPAANGNLDETPKTAEPGNVIRYVIDYVNFSLPLTGSSAGSVILDAANLVITENGSAAPNNWGAVSTHFSSGAVAGGFAQTTFATQGTITFDGAPIPDPATGAAVGIYVNNVGTIAPALNPTTFQGQFRFHRRVN